MPVYIYKLNIFKTLIQIIFIKLINFTFVYETLKCAF